MASSYYCLLVIFFFKQKTAYEMRISDWSSDVCSSDLEETQEHDGTHRRQSNRLVERRPARAGRPHPAGDLPGGGARGGVQRHGAGPQVSAQGGSPVAGAVPPRPRPRLRLVRSEEHTSELPSLMRITYAVFSLKQK